MARQDEDFTSIPANHHVGVFGRNGGGKTWGTRKYLAGYGHVVCLDTKGTTAWPEIPGTRWDPDQQTNPGKLLDPGPNLALVTHLADLMKVSPKIEKIIYRPVWEEMKEEYYNSFFKWIYMRQNCIVWVDEAMSVSPNPFSIPEYYKACLTRGRELNIGVWSLSQRPAGIAQVILSECKHFFVYDLNMPQDRKKLAEITGAVELLEQPGEFNFWYYYITWEHAVKARLVEK
jgi:hypothetical protein